MDINLIPEDDLIKELFNRYEHAIFAGAKTGYKTKDSVTYTHKYDGNSATCAGLAFQLATKITDDRILNSVEEK